MRWSFVVYCVTVILPQSREMAHVQFISTSGYFNPKYMSHLTTSILKDPHGLDVDVNLTRTIEKDLFLAVEVQIRLRDSTQYQRLFKDDFDVCKFSNDITKENLMKRWHRNVLKYGNFIDKCPVKPGLYFIRGLIVDQESVPMYLRPGDYRIVGRGYFKTGNGQSETLFSGYIEIKWIS